MGLSLGLKLGLVSGPPLKSDEARIVLWWRREAGQAPVLVTAFLVEPDKTDLALAPLCLLQNCLVAAGAEELVGVGTLVELGHPRPGQEQDSLRARAAQLAGVAVVAGPVEVQPARDTDQGLTHGDWFQTLMAPLAWGRIWRTRQTMPWRCLQLLVSWTRPAPPRLWELW